MDLRLKITTKVFLPAVALLAAFWAVVAVWAVAQRQEAIDTHVLVLRQLNSAVAEHFNGLLQLTEMSLAVADGELAARERGDETAHGHLLALADDLRRKSNDLVDLGVAHPDGTIEFTRPVPAAALAVDIRDRDYFAAQRAGSPAGTFIGAAAEARVDGRWVIPLTIVPSGTKKGEFAFAVIRVNRLAALHEQQRMQAGGAIGIVKTDGRLLSRAPLVDRLPDMSFKGLKDFESVWLKEGSGSYIAPRGLRDDKPRLISFTRLTKYDLFVYISVQLDRVLDPWRTRVKTVAVGMAAITAIMLLGAFYLARSLERYARSQQRFVDIAEIASDLIFEVDAGMHVSYLSDRHQHIFGVERERILGRRPRELGWLPADTDSAAQFAAALDDRRPFSNLVFRRALADLPEKFIALSAKPLFGDHDLFAGYRCVATDITERVQRERERELRAEREAQASKLEALGQLAGGIAHDFNNLLGAILGFAHFLVEDSAPDSQQRRYAERVMMAGQRGRGLVQQILTFSRRNPGEPSDVKLADLVHETYELLAATIPATTRLVIEDDGGDLVVTGDRSQLGQVLVNLCINASDALEGLPGEVRIAVTALDRSRPELSRLPNCVAKPTPAVQSAWSGDEGFDWIATGGLTAQDNVCIRVSDTGGGIPREHFAPLFDLFFTTKGSGSGTGLGLPVVQRVVTGHGGAVLVKTKVGVGTEFDVILPCSRLDFVPPDAEAAVVEFPSHRSATILVVDDDAGFCEMLEAALRRLGHEVVSVNDPLEGLAAVLEDPALWDLVVTDQTMPGMTGADLVRRIKAVRPLIRCVICTGYSASLNEPEALAAGADGFRNKPLDLDDFGTLVGRLLSPAD